jgi:hypothetical protein
MMAQADDDLIRYGKFDVEYVLPNDVLSIDKSNFRKLFPVPANELKLNQNLVQNPGY